MGAGRVGRWTAALTNRSRVSAGSASDWDQSAVRAASRAGQAEASGGARQAPRRKSDLGRRLFRLSLRAGQVGRRPGAETAAGEAGGGACAAGSPRAGRSVRGGPRGWGLRAEGPRGGGAGGRLGTGVCERGEDFWGRGPGRGLSGQPGAPPRCEPPPRPVRSEGRRAVRCAGRGGRAPRGLCVWREHACSLAARVRRRRQAHVSHPI